MIDSYSSTDHQATAAQILTFGKGPIDPVQGLNLWGLKYSLKLLLFCVRLRRQVINKWSWFHLVSAYGPN